MTLFRTPNPSRILCVVALGIALGRPTAAQTPAPTPPSPAPRVLTLDQFVALAVGNNSSVIIARQRLQKAQELITQTDAQARPQVRADIVDSYSSQASFGTAGSANIQNPTLPGGGQIPVIVDQGGGNTSAFVGGGGGGTTASTGSSSTTAGSATSAPATGGGSSSAAPISGTGTGGGTTLSPAPTSGGTGTSPGTGTTPGTGGTGTGGGGAVSPSALTQGLPPIARQFVAATKNAPPNNATAHAGGTSGGAPTGTGGTGGSGTTDTTITGRGGSHNNYSGRLTVTQYIDLFGLVPAARDVETITRDYYALDLQRVQNETALSARNTFFTVLRAQAQAGVAQEQVNAATENLRIAQARFTAGAAAQFDVLTAQTTLSNDQQALSAAQNQLNLARANINNLVGTPLSITFTLQEPPLPPLNQPIDLPQSTTVALRQRPELKEADNNITIAQRLIKLAGGTLLPTLGLAANANYAGPSISNGAHDTYSLAAQLGIPLYDGGDTQSRVRSARIDLQTQQTTRAQLQQNVALEVLQAYNNVTDAQTRASSAGVGVTSAQEALRLAQVRYQNGIGTLLDVLNAQSQLAQARTNLLSAQYDYQTSLAQLLRAEGAR